MLRDFVVQPATGGSPAGKAYTHQFAEHRPLAPSAQWGAFFPAFLLYFLIFLSFFFLTSLNHLPCHNALPSPQDTITEAQICTEAILMTFKHTA